jgi:hypothetical protein
VPHRPERFTLAQAHHFLVVGLEVQPVAHAELLARLLYGGHHAARVGRRRSQRLLADDVLARLRRPHHVLGVHGVGQHHVHNVDGRVVNHPVEGLVIVDVLVGDVVLLLPLGGLGRRARHDARQPAKLGLLQGRRQLPAAVAAQAHQRHAQLAVGRRGPGQPIEGPGQGVGAHQRGPRAERERAHKIAAGSSGGKQVVHGAQQVG